MRVDLASISVPAKPVPNLGAFTRATLVKYENQEVVGLRIQQVMKKLALLEIFSVLDESQQAQLREHRARRGKRHGGERPPEEE